MTSKLQTKTLLPSWSLWVWSRISHWWTLFGILIFEKLASALHGNGCKYIWWLYWCFNHFVMSCIRKEYPSSWHALCIFFALVWKPGTVYYNIEAYRQEQSHHMDLSQFGADSFRLLFLINSKKRNAYPRSNAKKFQRTWFVQIMWLKFCILWLFWTTSEEKEGLLW